jgi:hypothetical protein
MNTDSNALKYEYKIDVSNSDMHGYLLNFEDNIYQFLYW